MFTATIEPAGHHDLTHEASSMVAFGEHGEVVLTDRDNIYQYQHDGKKYSLEGKTRRHGHVGGACNKAISDTTIFMQLCSNGSPTHEHQLHTTDLRHIRTLDHKGQLCGLLYPNTLAYRWKRPSPNSEWIIILHQPNGEVTLQRSRLRRRKWDVGLSLCRAGEHIVVVERSMKSMDVFSTSGNILLLFYYI